MSAPALFAPLHFVVPSWPAQGLGQLNTIGHKLGVTAFERQKTSNSLEFSGTLAWLEEIELDIPLLNDASLALLPATGGGFSELDFKLSLDPSFSLTAGPLNCELRLRSKALRPVKETAPGSGEFEALPDVDGKPAPLAFELGGLEVEIDGEGDVELKGKPQITPPALEIGDTGVVLALSSVSLHLSSKQSPPIGAPAGFKGVAIDKVDIHLGKALKGAAAPKKVTGTDLRIGSSGFSGVIEADWDPTQNEAELFGLAFKLESLSFTFRQNTLTGSAIKASLELPFFDEWVEVILSFDAEGRINIVIDEAAGALNFEKSGLLRAEIDRIEIEVLDGKASLSLSGLIQPLFGADLEWPAFDVRNMSIDHKGRVSLDGGWVDLSSQKSLDFYGFVIELTRFGLGNLDTGERWLGVSGRINLLKGAKEQPSVEGLKIIWDDLMKPRLSLDGIGLETKVEGAYELRGEVSFKDDQGVRRFDGAATLSIDSPEITLDGKVAIAIDKATKLKGFYGYGAFEAPSGLPLGPTGIFLYGFAAMVGLNMAPDRASQGGLLPWYALPPEPDWYHKVTPGVTASQKWELKEGARAFGAGATFGTPDSGYTFNTKGLLGVATPGPVVFLDMAGNVLKPRKDLHGSDDPLFRVFTVYDKPAGEITFGLDLRYLYDLKTGGLIDLTAATEAYYSLNDPRDWYVYAGVKDPRTRRIKAEILSLFTAESYFMIDPDQLQMGAWVGIDKSTKAGPLQIILQAWMDAEAVVSTKPAHFHAGLWLFAKAEVSAFGVGVGLSLSADIDVDVIDPFHLVGDFEACIKLPWPIKKKICRSVVLEWGPKLTDPPVSAVLKGVAIEHFKSRFIWPLSEGDALLPSHADDQGFLQLGVTGGDLLSPPNSAPSVPIDARPALAFWRPVHDDALIGDNATTPLPDFECVGDPATNQGPAKVRYALQGVVLQEYDGSSWRDVAGKGAGASGLDPLFGMWTPQAAPKPGATEQMKLTLWARTGFEDFRFTGREYADWLTNTQAHYPCIPAPVIDCLDVEHFPAGHFDALRAADIWEERHFDDPSLEFDLRISEADVVILDTPTKGKTKALRLKYGMQNIMHLRLRFLDSHTPVRAIKFCLAKTGRLAAEIGWTDDDGRIEWQSYRSENGVEPTFSTPGPIFRIHLEENDHEILEICLSEQEDGFSIQKKRQHLFDSAQHWSNEDKVLKPGTDYRLVVRTQAKVVGAGAGSRNQTSFAYFRTDEPPALGKFSEVPVNASDKLDPNEALNTLKPYVAKTLPQSPLSETTGLPIARPVFRSYDIGVEFNENYVSQLYKSARRDLTIVILDQNGLPARDSEGRVLAYDQPWGVVSEAKLSETEEAWTKLIDQNCHPIDVDGAARKQTLSTAERAMLLPPDTRHTVRLSPHMIRESFLSPFYTEGQSATGEAKRLGEDWRIAQFGSAVATWTIVSDMGAHALAGGGGVSNEPASPVNDAQPGSALLFDPQGGGQTRDQRFAFYAANVNHRRLGAVFLYASPTEFHQLVIFPQDGLLRLCRHDNSGVQILGEAASDFDTSGDFEVEIDVSGHDIRVFLNGEPLISVTEGSAPSSGLSGLWCEAGSDARFKDVRIQGFGAVAVSAYAFDIVTSAFADFTHLAHSRRAPIKNVVRPQPLTDSLNQALSTASSYSAPLSEVEQAQHDALAEEALGLDMIHMNRALDVFRVVSAGSTEAFLVRSPEPLDWRRCEISLVDSAVTPDEADAYGPLKIIAAQSNVSGAGDLQVELISLRSMNLEGIRLQFWDPSIDKWEDLHAFSSFQIESGQRARLHAGAAPAQKDALRFEISLNALSGVPPVVSGMGKLFRIIDKEGDILTRQNWLPAKHFSTRSAQFLRSRDNTSFFVFPDGGQFDSNAYALDIVYRRDNSAQHPDISVQSRAGDRSVEVAFCPLY